VAVICEELVPFCAAVVCGLAEREGVAVVCGVAAISEVAEGAIELDDDGLTGAVA
jgi:hypothetical protein